MDGSEMETAYVNGGGNEPDLPSRKIHVKTNWGLYFLTTIVI